MYRPNLIFDLGAHDGKDTLYYLSKGHEVVAVEAHPRHAEEARQRAKPFGHMATIVQKAIAAQGLGNVKLYPSKRVGGETHSLRPHRVREVDAAPIMVATVSLANLFINFGVPHYMKVDIEGSDVEAMRQLHEWERTGCPMPPYLSVELDTDHPEEALEMFAHLGMMGYDTFRLVNQRLVPSGMYGPGFTWGMSGPFGAAVFNEDCEGYDLAEAAAWWFSNARMFKRDWFDLHCRHHTTAISGVPMKVAPAELVSHG